MAKWHKLSKRIIFIFICLMYLFSMPLPANAFYLPDTGQTTCYNTKGKGSAISCPEPEDSQAQDGSYTINPPSYTVNGDGTVFDNNTWLMWQQQDDGITRTWDEANSYCDSLSLAGYTDWRLPEKKELESIVNYGQLSPAIDTSVFPNTKADNYWSSTQHPSCDVQKAWYVHFGSGIDFSDDCTYDRSPGGGYSNKIFGGGNVNFKLKLEKLYTRCVRGGPLSFDDFVDNGNGTVTDSKTGLMWQQDEARDNRGRISAMKWGNALEYCEGLSLGGYTDWRLPNVRELLSLTDDTKTYPSTNTTFFPNVQSDSICSYGDDQTFFYWTSTTNASNTDNKLTVSFERGFTTSHHLRDRYNYVRCVRGGSPLWIDDREIKVEPSELDFDYLKPGESKSLSVTVTNIGKSNLMIGVISIPSTPFSIILDECSGKTLSALMSCSITIELHSLVEGTFTATLTIPSDDADNSNATVNLSGNVYDLAFLLHDTGQTTCYNDAGTVITCPSSGQSFAQDGSYTMNPPSYTINSNATVTDNNTGLIWQQSDDSIIRTWDEANSYCDNLTLGGYSDWRLPTKRELFGIVDFGRYSPSIDTSVFPNTKTDKYWSSTVNSSSNNAWYVYFGKLEVDEGCAYYYSYYRYNGVTVNPSDKSNKYYVRCVRGEKLPDSVFVDNGDGTVTDLTTGLIWQQGEERYETWESSISYCEGLSLAGYTDWRLPNIKELASLGDTQNDLIYKSTFSPDSCSGSGAYWSSTSIHYVTCSLFWAYQEAYLASLPSGLIFSEAKPYSDNRARCVRGGNTLLDSWEISVNPLTLNFGSIEVGGSSLLSFTVSNIGTENLVIRTITAPPFPFSITSDGCSGQTISSSASCFVTAKFAPTTEGIYTGSITIPSNDADSPSITVALSGTATKPSIPALTVTITSPQDGATVSSSPITVTGSVSNNAAVTVNNIQAIVRNDTFTASISLIEGQNTITATAVDQYGQTVSKSITVTLTTKGTIAGTVTDSSTGSHLPSATVSITDSSNTTQTALTGSDGTYAVSGIASGSFTISVTKDGYTTYSYSDTISSGQSIIINATLSPIYPVISNISTSGITTDSATITWTTDQLSDSLVEYGTTTSYGSSTSDSTLTTTHSITLSNLTSGTTYHFKITSKNSYGFTSVSGDNTFTTSQFKVTTIGDYGNVTVMEVTGNYDAKNPDGSLNTLPRQEIAKEFYRTHNDEYDFFVIFSNFDFQMPEAEARGFYLEVKNDTQGIGKQLFDDSSFYGSNGKLQGMIEMGNISNHGTNPLDPKFEDTISTLAHEQMHRWGASVKFKDPNGNISNALLGKDMTHWSFLLDSDASVMYGNDWLDNKDGTFTSTGKEKYYSALDLYLMGFYSKSQVAPMLLINNSSIDPTRLPEVGTTISGAARYITIDDIIAAEGERVPDSSSSQKSFKTAFILITTLCTFTGNETEGIENIRNGWAGRFASLTNGKGSVMDITPSITIAIASPSAGETISRPDVMVKGAIINTTGNETGVTVNGIVANVYGNQFIANHVPLTEGSNTITITATDTAGNIASTSITVNAVTTGNYIRITSNMESGIAPLEVTLKIDGTFSIENSSMSVTGPASIGLIDNPTPDEYRIRMNAEGVYTFTASATDPDGIQYQDTIVIIVMNKTQLDTLLKAKWEGMKTALINRDINSALNHYTEGTRQHYNQVFTDLYNYLSQFVQNMQNIELVYVKGNVAKYRIRKDEIYSGQTWTVTYYIYFVIDRDGIWRIDVF